MFINKIEKCLLMVGGFLFFIAIASFPVSLIFGFSRSWITSTLRFDILQLNVLMSGACIMGMSLFICLGREFLRNNSESQEPKG